MAVTVSRETHPRITLKGANSGTVNSGILVGSGDGNRVSMTFTATAEPIIVIPEGPVSDAQLEAGAFETSYIPNTADSGTVTRSADIASIPVSAFGYNQTAGTVVVEASSLAAVSGYYGSIVSIGIDGTNRIDLGTLDDAGWQSIRDDGIDTAAYSNLVSHNIGSYGSGVTSTAGLAFKLNSANAAVNGSIGTEDTSCTIPTVSEVKIGYDFSSRFRNGHIKSIQYFPRRLTNTQLQELTS